MHRFVSEMTHFHWNDVVILCEWANLGHGGVDGGLGRMETEPTGHV